MDIDAIVSKVDVDGLIDRVDVQKIIDRVDVDKIVSRVDVDEIIDRVDVEKIIDRVDVQEIIERVDIDSLVEKTELGTIIAHSTSGVASEALDLVRAQAVGLDDFVARWVNRILRRRSADWPVGPPSWSARPCPCRRAAVEATPMTPHRGSTVALPAARPPSRRPTGQLRGSGDAPGGLRRRRGRFVGALHPGRRRRHLRHRSS